MCGCLCLPRGYIPFVELVCERYIGETIQWILTLSLAPLACPIVPWLCCPLELGSTSITIHANQNCNDPGAVYGSTAFWTMNAISIVGLIFAIGSVGTCFAELAGENIEPDWFPLSFDLSDLTTAVIQDIDVKKVKKEGQLNFVKKRVLDYLTHKYNTELEKKEEKKHVRGKQNDEEPPGEDDAAMNTTWIPQGHHSRRKRQVVSVDIPTLQGFVAGGDDTAPDVCQRDEVYVVEEEECHQVLSQGPCEDDEVVLLDASTKKGYCGPRLCSPDRVFVFSDQMCHDPRELGLCPPGRMLFTSSFGTPVCGCPDGTYEEEDDPDEDVCEPVLGESGCKEGQVFWFSDFKRPAKCVADPCGGLNQKRGPSDLPHVPALFDGRCYQIGTRPPFCKSDQLYSISFVLLRGVCSTLEDAGFKVLDDDFLSFLASRYGQPLSRDSPGGSTRRKYQKTASSKRKIITPASTTLLRRPEIGSSVVHFGDQDDDSFTHPSAQLISVGGSVVPSHFQIPRHPTRTHSWTNDDHNDDDNEVENEVEDQQPRVTLLPTHVNAFSPSLISVNGSVTFLSFLNGMLTHHRLRRSPLPFASPGNVFEPGLSACRAGAKRDGNAKCRATVLPSRYPPARSRPRRSVPPVPARPACPTGTFWDVNRRCSPSVSGIASTINALGLGYGALGGREGNNTSRRGMERDVEAKIYNKLE